jgi:hypothetical protein
MVYPKLRFVENKGEFNLEQDTKIQKGRKI